MSWIQASYPARAKADGGPPGITGDLNLTVDSVLTLCSQIVRIHPDVAALLRG